ncbi:Immunoglobulin Kappa Variable 2D-40 [Manis pentadactyla]|nr:Immunoglobulin Kappa Variable 2D-40 [Manis pentadactyla]
MARLSFRCTVRPDRRLADGVGSGFLWVKVYAEDIVMTELGCNFDVRASVRSSHKVKGVIVDITGGEKHSSMERI